MKSLVGHALIAALLGAAACEPDRTPELRAELAELKKARVETELVTRAKAEREQAETDLATAREQASTDSTTAKVAAEAAETRAAALNVKLEGEASRNQALRRELEALVARQTDLAARIETRGAEKRGLQDRARWVRDQALAFAEQLGHDDPADLAERRRRALGEFETRVQELFPAARFDLAGLAGDSRGSTPAELRSELERLAERFTQRFALEDSATGTPPVAANNGPAPEERAADVP